MAVTSRQLRIRRAAAGLSRRQLAEVLGIPTTTVAYAERGVASAEVVQLLDGFLPAVANTSGVARRCEECSERFFRASARGRFCSAKCRYAHRDRGRHVPRGTLETTNCDRCGAPFEYARTYRPRRRCDACRGQVST
jgi:transcriptional regulator with XRE-family HTH domain